MFVLKDLRKTFLKELKKKKKKWLKETNIWNESDIIYNKRVFVFLGTRHSALGPICRPLGSPAP